MPMAGRGCGRAPSSPCSWSQEKPQMLAPGSGKLAKGTSLLLGHTEGGFRRDAVLFSSHPGAVGLQAWILTHGRSRPPFPSHGHSSLHPCTGDGTSLGMCRGRATADAAGRAAPCTSTGSPARAWGGQRRSLGGCWHPPALVRGSAGLFPHTQCRCFGRRSPGRQIQRQPQRIHILWDQQMGE